MAINNTEKIRPLLNFENPDHFYFVEVMRRRKENPEMEKHAEIVKDFFIRSMEDFDKKVPKMIDYANKFNARIYFRLNRRDRVRVALECNKRIAEMLINGTYDAVRNMYNSVCGSTPVKEDRTWVIDLDKAGDTEDDFLNWITNFGILETKFKNEGVWVDALDTKNGVHLITKPFRLDEFQNWAQKSMISVDVHKDNPTLLYIP